MATRDLTAVLVLCASLASCANYGAPLASDCNRHLAFVRIEVEPSARAVDALRRTLKLAPIAASRVPYQGFEYQQSDGSDVIVVPKIRGQNDDQTLTIWGHELAHVACGNWHRQPD